MLTSIFFQHLENIILEREGGRFQERQLTRSTRCISPPTKEDQEWKTNRDYLARIFGEECWDTVQKKWRNSRTEILEGFVKKGTKNFTSPALLPLFRSLWIQVRTPMVGRAKGRPSRVHIGTKETWSAPSVAMYTVICTYLPGLTGMATQWVPHPTAVHHNHMDYCLQIHMVWGDRWVFQLHSHVHCIHSHQLQLKKWCEDYIPQHNWNQSQYSLPTL